jgi:hypothetical protein
MSFGQSSRYESMGLRMLRNRSVILIFSSVWLSPETWWIQLKSQDNAISKSDQSALSIPLLIVKHPHLMSVSDELCLRQSRDSRRRASVVRVGCQALNHLKVQQWRSDSLAAFHSYELAEVIPCIEFPRIMRMIPGWKTLRSGSANKK